MKTKPCKHTWYQTAFIGDPFNDYPWNCKVQERCASCTKERERHATHEEFEAEIKRLTCQTCGFRIAGHGNDGCIRLLGNTIRELQEQVKSLQEWKNG